MTDCCDKITLAFVWRLGKTEDLEIESTLRGRGTRYFVRIDRVRCDNCGAVYQFADVDGTKHADWSLPIDFERVQ